ncbi:HAD family hydrolase [Kitasatospora sp. LaBMicrA B282]|uniref:HAD family hydrolase n=1 Tax=Kitasatospora sp. LaBMicrA B282 TaxID=3420949 RepID=UPI003D15042E
MDRRSTDRTAPLLVLWDIDHTLVDIGTVGRRSYAVAFQRATGRPLTESWQFAGRTEPAAAAEVLRLHGFDPGDGLLTAFLELVVAELTGRAAELAAEGRVLPGAAAALAALGDRPGVRQSVLTGNLHPLAVLKLDALGLSDRLDLRLGAFGDDAVERTELPAHAFDRAERVLGHRFRGGDTVIIGDTPRDVATALAVGARSVAVATGLSPAAELAAAGAHVVLPDLADTEAVLRAVLG